MKTLYRIKGHQFTKIEVEDSKVEEFKNNEPVFEDIDDAINFLFDSLEVRVAQLEKTNKQGRK